MRTALKGGAQKRLHIGAAIVGMIASCEEEETGREGGKGPGKSKKHYRKKEWAANSWGILFSIKAGDKEGGEAKRLITTSKCRLGEGRKAAKSCRIRRDSEGGGALD